MFILVCHDKHRVYQDLNVAELFCVSGRNSEKSLDNSGNNENSEFSQMFHNMMYCAAQFITSSDQVWIYKMI